MADARQDSSRREIVAAATRLFAEQGVRATSLATIADEIGVTKAALYHYFSSRQDLVLETVRANIATFEDEVVSGGEDLSGIAALEKEFQRKIDQAERQEGLNLRFFYTVMLEQLDEPEIDTEFSEFFDQSRERLRSLVAAGQREGTFSADIDVDALLTVLFGTVMGVDLLWLRSPDSIDLRAAYDIALEQFLTVIQP